MATAQKRGFRFPWGGDSRREEPEASDAPSIAERLAGTPEDLGRGPFDLPEGSPASEPDATEPPSAEAAPQVATAATPPRLVMRAPNAEPMVIATPVSPGEAPAPMAGEPEAAQPEPEPVATAPEVPEPEPEPDAAALPEPEPDFVAATLPEPQPEPESEPHGTWPDADRRASRPSPTAKAAPSGTTTEARRANPLVAGLVRAMREAARAAHDEAVATLRVDVAARTEAIREHGTARATELKRAAEADVLSIREWSKAEMARVREETESRIAARKIQLVAETERESRDTDALLDRLTAAVEAFEAETDAFFKTLLAEEDPGRLAGLAEQLPPPPSLEEFPAGEPVGVHATHARAGRSPSHAPGSSAFAPTDTSQEGEPPLTMTVVPTAMEAPADDASRADGLDADAAAAAEAEALLGLDEKTQLVVSGLSSVGAIAAFKGALLNSPGVSAVSVNAGDNGDVLITMTHAAGTDVRRALRDIEAFQPAVIADDGATLVVVAREPAA